MGQTLKILMFMVTLSLAKQMFWTHENQPPLLAFLLALSLSFIPSFSLLRPSKIFFCFAGTSFFLTRKMLLVPYIVLRVFMKYLKE